MSRTVTATEAELLTRAIEWYDRSGVLVLTEHLEGTRSSMSDAFSKRKAILQTNGYAPEIHRIALVNGAGELLNEAHAPDEGATASSK